MKKCKKILSRCTNTIYVLRLFVKLCTVADLGILSCSNIGLGNPKRSDSKCDAAISTKKKTVK